MIVKVKTAMKSHEYIKQNMNVCNLNFNGKKMNSDIYEFYLHHQALFINSQTIQFLYILAKMFSLQ